MTSRIFEITSDTVRRSICTEIVRAPIGWFVRLMPATRTLLQNSKLHATISDIGRLELYNGRHLATEQWKTLFISGHAIATGLGADMVAGIEQEPVNIRESSAHMSIARMSSLIEYISAWWAQNGRRRK